MREIIGNTTATPNPRPDWAQTNPAKADYIKNKPTLGTLAAKDEVAKGDLSEDVQTALDNANSALQSYTETDPTVPGWAKEATKPSYTPDEVGALPKSTTLADLTDDATHRTVTDAEKAVWNLKSDFSGSYNDLTDIPPHDYIPISQKGATSGVATLDENGHVPSTQLPSYVDDVIEGYINDDKSKFYQDEAKTTEIVPETGKIYLDLTSLRTYRWGGSVFAEISESLALGETSNTAYYGDKGKAAYEHSQIASGNPHGTVAKDLGLENVDNTSDANKPVSTAQATAIADAKKAGMDAQDNLDTHLADKNNPHGVSLTQLGVTAEEWIFTLEDGSTITRVVYVG